MEKIKIYHVMRYRWDGGDIVPRPQKAKLWDTGYGGHPVAEDGICVCLSRDEADRLADNWRADGIRVSGIISAELYPDEFMGQDAEGARIVRKIPKEEIRMER